MSVTRDTSHSPISPCGLLEQSPSGDSFRHAARVFLSSVVDPGENVGLEVQPVEDNFLFFPPFPGVHGTDPGVHTLRDIDPNEPSNISILLGSGVYISCLVLFTGKSIHVLMYV